MKKVLALVLALTMVLGSFGTVFAASYSDVEGTYEDAISRLSTLGILTGYNDGTFKPENNITRAEFAAVAMRAKGLEAAATAAKGLPTGFTDVNTAHWASGYVGTAARLSIVNGVGNGQFAPESPVKYEEAITMLVRALGYEASATAKGGYPYGYLVVANEIGLLDAVKGTQGTAATRGAVAQMTDNALEIPMMVQVGFGTESKWVISGTKEHGGSERYLLDDLGFDSVEGLVVSKNTRAKKITIDPTDEDLRNVTIDVKEGFDYYEVEGAVAKFWYKDDVVEVYVVQEAPVFDAVTVDKDQLKLVVEDEKYDVAKGATLTLDGEKVDQDEFTADYAKIAINDDDEIIWAEGYTLDGFILVEEVKDNVAYSYAEYDELKIKDFLVVEEGKTIGIDGIEEGDILFYNAEEEVAVVFNNGTEGKLERAYIESQGFRFEGKRYQYSDIADPIYFDEGKVGELTDAILADFYDEEATITVYADFAGKVVVVSGEVTSVGSSAYGVLTSNPRVYSGRKGNMLALDIRNGANEKVSYDIEVADLDNDVELVNVKTVGTGLSMTLAEDTNTNPLAIEKNIVLKVSVDKDGDVTAIELPEYENDGVKSFKIDATNVTVEPAGGTKVTYRLQASTVVFHDENKKATTIGNAKDEFEEVEAGSDLYYEKGRVVAVVGTTNADADTKTVSGLVKSVRGTSNDRIEFTVEVFGTTQRLVTENKDSIRRADADALVGKIVSFTVGEKSGAVRSAVQTRSDLITIRSINGSTITPTVGDKVELNRNAVIYKGTDTVALRTLEAGDTITVYYNGNSKTFIDYVVVGVSAPGHLTTGVVTHKNATPGSADEGRIMIDDKLFTVTPSTILYSANKTVLGVGYAGIQGSLTVNATQVVDVQLENSNIVSLRLKANFTALNTEISTVEALNESGYASGWSTLQTTLTAAKKVAANGLSTQTEVDTAKANLEAARLALVAKDNDTTLATLSYGSTAITPINAANNVTLPYGTTTVPTVTATATATTSTVSVAQATSLTGTSVARTAVVTVTAADGSKAEYEVTFSVAAPSSAKAITATTIGTLNSGNIGDVPAGTIVSALKAALTVSPDATVEILVASNGAVAPGADSVNATMVIEVTAQDGTSAEYTITMQ